MTKDATYISPEIAAVFRQILGLSIWKGLLMLKVFQRMVLSFLKGHLPDMGFSWRVLDGPDICLYCKYLNTREAAV